MNEHLGAVFSLVAAERDALAEKVARARALLDGPECFETDPWGEEVVYADALREALDA